MPAVLAITAIRPGIGAPNGFSARYAHFLRGLAHEFPLQVLLLERRTLSPLLDPPDLPAECRAWDRAPRGTRGGAVGLAVRLQQALMSPAWAVPTDAGRGAAGEGGISLAVGLHFRAADVLLSLPRAVRKVAVLEEYDPTLIGGSIVHRAGERLEVWREGRLFRRVGRQVDLVIAISADEARRWRLRCPGAEVAVVPHGVDCDHFAPREAQLDLDIGFFGMLAPGRDGGALRAATALRAHPRTAARRMGFIGAEPSRGVRAWAAMGACVTGRVRDMREWYARTAVVVAADEGGPGVKTTVLEAWAMARPVVATPAALRDLPARDGENVLVAATESDLVSAVTALLDDSTLARRIGCSAREIVMHERHVGQAQAELVRLCKSVLAQPRRRDFR